MPPTLAARWCLIAVAALIEQDRSQSRERAAVTIGGD